MGVGARRGQSCFIGPLRPTARHGVEEGGEGGGVMGQGIRGGGEKRG